MPKGEILLQALVQLARIMSKCVNRIYSQRHDSLLPLWNAANEIRQELYGFAEQQMKVMQFGLVGDLSSGERGVYQAMISTSETHPRECKAMANLLPVYHHTVLLTFRPFLILRAKLRQETASLSKAPQTPPPWLDAACEQCLEAARNTVDFLLGACQKDTLCRVRSTTYTIY